MLKLTRQVEYALIALKHMYEASDKPIVAVREICDTHQIPFDATARVLQKLTRKGILTSVQGTHGGYQLETNLNDLNFYTFIEIVVGPLELAACMGVSGSCALVETCNIISPLSILNDRLSDFYKSISLGELFDASSPRETTIRERFKSQETGTPTANQ